MCLVNTYAYMHMVFRDLIMAIGTSATSDIVWVTLVLYDKIPERRN